jgi:HPt (histidine-containing phosphotransfer) domain-containing protein
MLLPEEEILLVFFMHILLKTDIEPESTSLVKRDIHHIHMMSSNSDLSALVHRCNDLCS